MEKKENRVVATFLISQEETPTGRCSEMVPVFRDSCLNILRFKKNNICLKSFSVAGKMLLICHDLVDRPQSATMKMQQ